jgi:hypothetical protein
MRTTLDERVIVQAVAQLGGFAPAAKELNRSQSTISYPMADPVIAHRRNWQRTQRTIRYE